MVKGRYLVDRRYEGSHHVVKPTQGRVGDAIPGPHGWG